MKEPINKGIHNTVIRSVTPQGIQEREDQLVVEEPLEILVEYGLTGARKRTSLAITMRTPGHDQELVLGFLYTEGIIDRITDVLLINHLPNRLHPDARENVILVALREEVRFDAEQLNRHFYMTSSCGICGKASLELVQQCVAFTLRPYLPQVSIPLIYGLGEQLRTHQTLFSQTGGIHAAGLFESSGRLLAIREDVGRHNAMDKLLGVALQRHWLPLKDHIIVLSGRAGFELVQKGLTAGLPVLASVGAPSSLSVQLADDHNMTLIGFIRPDRFNVYSGQQRLTGEGADAFR